MGKDRIAFVVQRYGENINGGAEYHCRVLAEHMTAIYDVDILTSCAQNYTPWDNFYKSGIEDINGVRVRRFSVDKIRDDFRFRELTACVKKGDKDVENEWMEELGPCCPTFVTYLEEHAREYKAIIFFTYAYYLTYMGLGLQLDNAILLPTAHDEPNIYIPLYKNVFERAKGILYNSYEERQFIVDHFDVKDKPSRLTCVGIDIPENMSEHMPERLKEYKDNYIVYVGRVSNGKNFQELNQFFMEYRKRNPSSLKMIVIGKVDEGMKIVNSKDIIYAGFIPEEEKQAIIQNAKLLVMPSKYESLSLVILESMAVKKPVLVNGRCEVLKGQCIRSNAGLYYMDFLEFEAGMNYILSNQDAYEQMCGNGYRFVMENYEWNAIVKQVQELIEEIG